MRLLILAAAMLSTPLLSSAEDLLEVYAQARAADPQLAAADATRGIVREQANQARAALLPQWSLSATALRDQGSGVRTGQIDSTISQVLVDLSRLREWDARQTLASAQDAALTAAEQELCARVATAYFGVLSAQASLRTTQANEGAFSRQVDQAKSRFDAGLSAAVEVDQARAYHLLARGNTVQAAQRLADAKQALAQITGRAPGDLKPLAAELPALPPQPAEPEAWVAQALQANPSLNAQRLVLKSSEQRISAARAGHLPTLSVGLDSQRLRGPEMPRGTDTQVALRLNFPLFAGFAVQSQTRQAQHEREATRGETEMLQRALVRETNAQHQAVLAGVTLMDNARAAVQAATQMLDATRAGQQLGTRSMTDLLLAIQTQANAQNAYEQARHGYVLAKLLLQRAAGGLNESELAAVNNLLKD